jgi:hypothetical protein
VTYTLRGIPDKLWDEIKRNAEMSGIPVRKYILLVLERSNVKFKIVEPHPETDGLDSSKSKLGGRYKTSE